MTIVLRIFPAHATPRFRQLASQQQKKRIVCQWDRIEAFLLSRFRKNGRFPAIELAVRAQSFPQIIVLRRQLHAGRASEKTINRETTPHELFFICVLK